jgi:DNA-directed RNA polymerase subunit RPC12/RpoP
VKPFGATMIFDEEWDGFFDIDKDYEVYTCPNCHWEGYRKDMKCWMKIPLPGEDAVVEKLSCPKCNFYSGVTRDSFVDD